MPALRAAVEEGTVIYVETVATVLVLWAFTAAILAGREQRRRERLDEIIRRLR